MTPHPYLHSERGGMTARPYIGETYRKLERLWFEVREANMCHNIVDTVDELFQFANLEAEMEEEREEHEKELGELDDKIAKLEAQVETLEKERDDLEERLEQALNDDRGVL